MAPSREKEYLNDEDDDETLPPSDEEMEDTNTEEESDEVNSTKGLNVLKPDVLWFDNNFVVHAVTKSIQKHFEKACTCWTNADEEEKKMWWTIFKSRFQWEPNLDDTVKLEFEKTTARRLKGLVSKAMKAKKRPRWMGKELRKNIKKLRRTTDFKKRSLQATKNKRGTNKGVAHTQGSVSARELARRHFNAHNEVLTPAEWFHKTHMKDDGTWADEKAKQVWGDYESNAGERHTKEDNDAYLKAAGGIKKDGTVYGVGNLSQMYYPLPHISKTSKQLPFSSIVLQLEGQLEITQQELKNTQEELKVTKNEWNEYKESSEKERKEFQAMVLDMKKDMALMSEALHCSDFSINTPVYQP